VKRGQSAASAVAISAEISRPGGPLSYDGIVAKRIGELLVEGGVLSQSQLEQALFAQRKDGRKLGQLLVELGLVSEIQVTQTLSRQLSVPWVSLYHVDFSRSLLNLVPREIAEKYCLIPIFVRRVRKQGETLYVAMDDPTNEAAIEDVKQAAALPVKPMIACPSDVRAAIRVYYLGEAAPPPPPSAATIPQSAPSAPSLAVVPPAPSSTQLAAKPAPPLPERVRSSRVDLPPAELPPAPQPPPVVETVPPDALESLKPPTDDSPEAAPDIQAEEREVAPPKRRGPRMFSLTLLDGTTISLPTPPKKRASAPDVPVADHPREREEPANPGRELSDQLTARDLVSALRAVSHGVDASEILGAEPRWEAMFSTLLSILLRKGLIADWEFIEEFRKI
jgi:type IV pilus assembly protein PilB